jgi:hypothetical protein
LFWYFLVDDFHHLIMHQSVPFGIEMQALDEIVNSCVQDLRIALTIYEESL